MESYILIVRFGMILLLSLFMTSCSCCKYPYCTEGAEEFVLDSYRIRQGKFSILEMEGEAVPALPCCYLDEYEDLIDEDDVLTVILHHPTRCDLVQAVGNVGSAAGYRVVNGFIHLPEIGSVYIKGLTLEQARLLIEQAYNDQIANVHIFLEYAARLHSKVELIGQVRVPEVPVNGRIRLYEVLSLAGIPPYANLFKSYIIRNGCMLPVDFYKLVREGDMCQNIVMQPKDKIYIADPLDASIMVLGEVGLAKTIPVPNGYLSLREAIAQAGGIPFTGDKRCILVIRGSIMCPKIYRLSWNHITYLPNDSLLLMPGDTVYISEKPITRWNRFIDQLLPSSLLIDLGIKTKGLLH